jgi:hypothetical protein
MGSGVDSDGCFSIKLPALIWWTDRDSNPGHPFFVNTPLYIPPKLMFVNNFLSSYWISTALNDRQLAPGFGSHRDPQGRSYELLRPSLRPGSPLGFRPESLGHHLVEGPGAFSGERGFIEACLQRRIAAGAAICRADASFEF